MEISNCTLLDFIEQRKSDGIDFAKITYICGATIFTETDWESDRHITKHRFKNSILKGERLTDSLFVAYITESSYLLYQEGDEIMIWVCYTLEEKRKKGRMGDLLKYIKSKYCSRKIIIDTRDESLIKMTTKIGIDQFTNMSKNLTNR